MKVEKNKESGQREKLRKLQEIAASARDMEENSQNVSGILYQEYSLESRKGRQFYESLEDECLLRLLRERAKELDHSPSQKEVFWVLREYLRKRFGKWQIGRAHV